MKNTGLVRRVDLLGRIVIPKEIRESFDIARGDGLEIFVDDDRIILRPYRPGCIFCGEYTENLVLGKLICIPCYAKLRQ